VDVFIDIDVNDELFLLFDCMRHMEGDKEGKVEEEEEEEEGGTEDEVEEEEEEEEEDALDGIGATTTAFTLFLCFTPSKCLFMSVCVLQETAHVAQ
jgi:hypothetical protein